MPTTITRDPLAGVDSAGLIAHAEAHPEDVRIADAVAYRTANWNIGERQRRNLTHALRLHTEALALAAEEARGTVQAAPKRPKGGRPRDVRTVNGESIDYTEIREWAWDMRQRGEGPYQANLASLCKMLEVPLP